MLCSCLIAVCLGSLPIILMQRLFLHWDFLETFRKWSISFRAAGCRGYCVQGCRWYWSLQRSSGVFCLKTQSCISRAAWPSGRSPYQGWTEECISGRKRRGSGWRVKRLGTMFRKGWKTSKGGGSHSEGWWDQGCEEGTLEMVVLDYVVRICIVMMGVVGSLLLKVEVPK